MARARLLDAWNRSRRERTRMPWGRRVASMEAALGADMTPGRHARWERLDHFHAQPEHDTEHQVDEHQEGPDQHATEHEEESAAGSDQHSETGERSERERAPHPGVQAREFEEQLFSETFGGAGLAHDQVGDAAQEVDHQQRNQPQPETEQPETEQPETEQPETEQPETEQPETEQPETEQPAPEPESEPELEDDEVEP